MKPDSPHPDSLPRIIIVGGGFGGLAAARELKTARAHVGLIDKTNHHVFQPLLYQVATGVLSPEHIAAPLRLVLGAFAEELLLSGQRVTPQAALGSGFRFLYPTIDDALGAIVVGARDCRR